MSCARKCRCGRRRRGGSRHRAPRVVISVSQPNEGHFRIHLPSGHEPDRYGFGPCHRAMRLATLPKRARQAGANAVRITMSEDVKLVPLGAVDMFIEALVYATADGTAN